MTAGNATRTLQSMLLTFLLLLTYDGALRKWILPQVETLVFITKDVLLMIMIAFAVSLGLHQHARARVPIHVQVALAFYAFWVFIEIFNPHLPNILVGVWGLKSHLLYAGLILLVPAAFPRIEDALGALTRVYPFIAIPVSILALVQVASPVDSWVNFQLEAGQAAMGYFGTSSLLRVSGTFSYITGMSAFSICMANLGLGFLLLGYRSLPFLVGLALVLLSLPTTGSRSVISSVAFGVSVMMVAGVIGRAFNFKVAASAVGGFLALAMFAFIVADLSHSAMAWEALYQRFEENRHDEDRIVTTFTNAFRHFDTSGWLGFGTGAANYGSLAFVDSRVPFYWLPNNGSFEEESGRIVLEIGFLGWLLSLAVRIILVLWACVVLIRGMTASDRAAAVLALPVLIMGLHQGSGVFAASYGAVAYWFAVSLLAMTRIGPPPIRATAPNAG